MAQHPSHCVGMCHAANVAQLPPARRGENLQPSASDNLLPISLSNRAKSGRTDLNRLRNHVANLEAPHRQPWRNRRTHRTSGSRRGYHLRRRVRRPGP
ncbi:hypothetical protein PSCLAVI8L_150079 [Pseudoclavibacter sp. 8L]|nr:hypothetical protein PSCLAVI8L_150079 [Pseudoclavibacter sp. 8L]